MLHDRELSIALRLARGGVSACKGLGTCCWGKVKLFVERMNVVLGPHSRLIKHFTRAGLLDDSWVENGRLQRVSMPLGRMMA